MLIKFIGHILFHLQKIVIYASTRSFRARVFLIPIPKSFYVELFMIDIASLGCHEEVFVIFK